MLVIASALAMAVMAQVSPTAAQGIHGSAGTSQIVNADDRVSEDPAQLINTGIEHARRGEEAAARAMFETAIALRERIDLETADGKWMDSRQLARHALAMLDRGDFRRTETMAAR